MRLHLRGCPLFGFHLRRGAEKPPPPPLQTGQPPPPPPPTPPTPKTMNFYRIPYRQNLTLSASLLLHPLSHQVPPPQDEPLRVLLQYFTLCLQLDICSSECEITSSAPSPTSASCSSPGTARGWTIWRVT